MALPTRNEVMTLLFNRLVATTFSDPTHLLPSSTWITTSRRLKLWGDVPKEQQPALYLVEHDEEYNSRNRATPRRGELTAHVFAYARADGNLVGGEIVNIMMDAIESAFAPDDGQGTCTLGGKVNWCYIDGRVFKDPGDIDDQILLIVPTRIMIP